MCNFVSNFTPAIFCILPFLHTIWNLPLTKSLELVVCIVLKWNAWSPPPWNEHWNGTHDQDPRIKLFLDWRVMPRSCAYPKASLHNSSVVISVPAGHVWRFPSLMYGTSLKFHEFNFNALHSIIQWHLFKYYFFIIVPSVEPLAFAHLAASSFIRADAKIE